MMPIVGHDWWELDGEDRVHWIADVKGFLLFQETRYRKEAAAIRCRGTTSPAARRKARTLRLADAIRRSVSNDTYTTTDSKIGDRWVLYIRLGP